MMMNGRMKRQTRLQLFGLEAADSCLAICNTAAGRFAFFFSS